MAEQVPAFGWQRRRLASKRSTPMSTLIALVQVDRDVVDVLAVRRPDLSWLQLALILKHVPPQWRSRLGSTVFGKTAFRLASAADPLSAALETMPLPPDVAQDTATERSLMLLLAHSRWHPVRRLVAGHPRTPSEALMALAQDEYAVVRDGVARREDAPPAALARLARSHKDTLMFEDSSYMGRSHRKAAASELIVDSMIYAVARHASTPHATLEALSTTHWASGVAANPGAPAWMLTELARRAISMPETPREDGGSTLRDQILDAVARNPRTPVGTLRTLVVSGEGVGVAANPSTPPDLLVALASDERWWAREAVAANPNTPTETLTRLAQDHDFEVRSAANLRLGNYWS
ncbi:hypothetical protein [Isoptericola sp. 178]|uniref:hypothetical protein n=1 Tax=Isoptericola sp. 178 TaxID=3064651 RepID=UPI002714223F|nr:hypothetical protein [Isoptericola sp. 178]MDO8144928.1 hypothetical protein [Isoptericola sp. 178]